MAMKPVKKGETKTAKHTTASKDEQIGFHKGSLATLAKEREEMIKILSIVEQLMQMHVAGLKELGVDLEKIARQAAKKTPVSKGKNVGSLEGAL